MTAERRKPRGVGEIDSRFVIRQLVGRQTGSEVVRYLRRQPSIVTVPVVDATPGKVVSFIGDGNKFTLKAGLFTYIEWEVPPLTYTS